MLYDFSYILFHWKKNALFYIFLFLELTLCFSMILIGLDENQSYQHRRVIYDNAPEENLISLTNTSWFIDSLNLNKNLKTLNDEQIIFGQIYPIEWINNSGAVKSLKLLVANAPFFRQCFNEVPITGFAYCSSILKQQMEDLKQFLEPEVSWIGKDVLQWYNQSLRIKPIHELGLKNRLKIIPTSPFESGDILLENTILVFTADQMIASPIYGFMKIAKEQMNPALLTKVSALTGQELHYSNLKADFEKGAESQSAFVRLFGWIAWIALFVILFGTSAMIVIFMDNRRQILRIQNLLGATTLRLRLQIFGELAMTMMLSYIAALLLRWLLDPFFSNVYYLIRPSIIATLSGVGLVFILSVLITLFSSTATKWKRK